MIPDHLRDHVVPYGLVFVQTLLFGGIAARMSRDMPGGIDPLDSTSMTLAVLTLAISVLLLMPIVREDRIHRQWLAGLTAVAALMGLFLALSLPEEARLGARFWLITEFGVLIPLSTILLGIGHTTSDRRPERIVAALKKAPVVLHAGAYGSAVTVMFVLWGWIETETQETHQRTPDVSLFLVLFAVLLLAYSLRMRRR